MNNLKTSNLIAFSESIEKFLKQDCHIIKESFLDAKNNIESIKENLFGDEDLMPIIEPFIISKDNKEVPDAESKSEEETSLLSSSTLIDYSININENPMREYISKEKDNKPYGDDLKMETKFDNNDDKNMSIYGCKCSKDNKWCDYNDINKNISINDFNHGYSEPSWNNRLRFDEYSDDFSKSSYNKFDDIGKNDKEKITMVAEGKGTIFNVNAKYEASPEISFKFFIGKKSDKYVGNICLVNYNEEILLTSDQIECFNSTNHNKFVAIFHVEEEENETREITIYGTTQVCNILPTLFVFSAPHCGETDIMSMGGSVTTGKIKIAKKDDK